MKLSFFALGLISITLIGCGDPSDSEAEKGLRAGMEVVKNSYGAILGDKCPESKAELEENPLAVQFCLAMHSEISDVKVGKCIDI